MLDRFLAWDARSTARLSIAEDSGPLRTAAAILAHSGDSWFWLMGLGLLWLLSEAGWRVLSLRLAVAIVLTAGFVLALKFTVRRRRPEGTWGGIYRKTDPHSFPSGHAARAVLLACLTAGWGPAWLAAALAVWAPLVVLARVAMGVHYLSDVFAGAALGLLIGALGILLFPL